MVYTKSSVDSLLDLYPGKHNFVRLYTTGGWFMKGELSPAGDVCMLNASPDPRTRLRGSGEARMHVACSTGNSLACLATRDYVGKSPHSCP